jgi:hypothetical protein
MPLQPGWKGTAWGSSLTIRAAVLTRFNCEKRVHLVEFFALSRNNSVIEAEWKL